MLKDPLRIGSNIRVYVVRYSGMILPERRDMEKRWFICEYPEGRWSLVRGFLQNNKERLAEYIADDVLEWPGEAVKSIVQDKEFNWAWRKLDIIEAHDHGVKTSNHEGYAWRITRIG